MFIFSFALVFLLHLKNRLILAAFIPDLHICVTATAENSKITLKNAINFNFNWILIFENFLQLKKQNKSWF